MDSVAKDIGELLQGCQYRTETNDYIVGLARENKVVIVYGYSDDLLEFDGYLHDEFNAYEGTSLYINIDGGLSINEIPNSVKIDAIWCPKDLDASWLIKTKIPHYTFDSIEYGEIFCRGVVFSLDTLKSYLRKSKIEKILEDDTINTKH